MSLLYFLSKNNKWLKINNVDLYNFALGIAKSKPASRDKVILQIQQTLKKHLTDFK